MTQTPADTAERTPVYQAMAWHDELTLDLAYMDDTHHEFVDLLAQLTHEPDETLLPLWDTVIAHTQEHFDREDRWMAQTQFGPGSCHSREHSQILQIMREVAKRGAAGNLAMVRQMNYELGIWFNNHAQGMDAGLADHLRAVGFDPVTGSCAQPALLEASGASGSCG
jgi:hemerythrin-like metal-binding protein